MNLDGGVGIWIKSAIEYTILPSPFILETITISLPKPKKSFPTVPYNFLTEWQFYTTFKLKGKYPNHDLIVAGDFNINLLTFDTLHQKKAIHKVYNLPYCDHTLPFFIKGECFKCQS